MQGRNLGVNVPKKSVTLRNAIMWLHMYIRVGNSGQSSRSVLHVQMHITCGYGFGWGNRCVLLGSDGISHRIISIPDIL